MPSRSHAKFLAFSHKWLTIKLNVITCVNWCNNTHNQLFIIFFFTRPWTAPSAPTNTNTNDFVYLRLIGSIFLCNSLIAVCLMCYFRCLFLFLLFCFWFCFVRFILALISACHWLIIHVSWLTCCWQNACSLRSAYSSLHFHIYSFFVYFFGFTHFAVRLLF